MHRSRFSIDICQTVITRIPPVVLRLGVVAFHEIELNTVDPRQGAQGMTGTLLRVSWLNLKRDKVALLLDLYLPAEHGALWPVIVWVHGGAWRVGDKDLGTRTFFRRLAAQGHSVLDVAYTLWPGADIPTMIGEIKHFVSRTG